MMSLEDEVSAQCRWQRRRPLVQLRVARAAHSIGDADLLLWWLSHREVRGEGAHTGREQING